MGTYSVSMGYVPINLNKNMYPHLCILHIDMYPYFWYDMGTETKQATE